MPQNQLISAWQIWKFIQMVRQIVPRHFGMMLSWNSSPGACWTPSSWQLGWWNSVASTLFFRGPSYRNCEVGESLAACVWRSKAWKRHIASESYESPCSSILRLFFDFAGVFHCEGLAWNFKAQGPGVMADFQPPFLQSRVIWCRWVRAAAGGIDQVVILQSLPVLLNTLLRISTYFHGT